AALVHLTFLAAVALTLPLGIANGFSTPPSDGLTLWVMGLFAASIGIPFVALSATAPLLQAWFVTTDHTQARNPYVLYAASNLGSFSALLAYPFLIEPLLTLRTQTLAWSVGFSMLAVLIAIAAAIAVRGSSAAMPASSSARPTIGRR